MKRILTILFFGAVILGAQEPDGRGSLSILPYSHYEDLKAYLGLTDSQVRSLESNLAEKHRAEQAIYQQISDKHRTLYTLLNEGSTDALQIGRLMVDIQALQKQIPAAGAPFRAPALAVLTAEQKAKLTALENAMKLQQAGWQAVTLNLLDPAQPPIGLPRILPAADLPALAPPAQVEPFKLGAQ